MEKRIAEEFCDEDHSGKENIGRELVWMDTGTEDDQEDKKLL